MPEFKKSNESEETSKNGVKAEDNIKDANNESAAGEEIENNQNDNNKVESVGDKGVDQNDKAANVQKNDQSETESKDKTTSDSEKQDESEIQDDKSKSDFTSAKLDSLVLTLMRRRLPYILPRYKAVSGILYNLYNFIVLIQSNLV